MKKKWLTLLLFIMMLAGFSVTGRADGTKTITLGTPVSDSLTETVKSNRYTFTLPQSGMINIELTAYCQCTRYDLYDSNGVRLWDSGVMHWNDNTQRMYLNVDHYLTCGTYELLVYQNHSYSGHDYKGNYNFTINFTPANESFPENVDNVYNTFGDARAIKLGQTYTGQLAVNDKTDYYKFVIAGSGAVSMEVSAGCQCTRYRLYNANGVQVWDSGIKEWNANTKLMHMQSTVHLISGTYVLQVFQQHDYSGHSYVGNYTFSVDCTFANESFKEDLEHSNNSFQDASLIELDKKYIGQLADNDDKDYYQFRLDKTMEVTLDVSAGCQCTWYGIYGSDDGNLVWKSGAREWNSNTQMMQMSEKTSLSAGSYVLLVKQDHPYSGHSYTGNYTFSLQTAAVQQNPGVTDQGGSNSGAADQGGSNSGVTDQGGSNTNVTNPDVPKVTKVTKVKLNKGSAKLYLGGKKLTLKVSVSPANASDKTVTWKSSDPSVASVSASGVVKAKKAGTAKITCTAKDGSGKTATCKVTVYPAKAVIKNVKISAKKVKFTIKKQSGVTGYQVYVKKSSGKKYQKYKTLKKSTLSFSCTRKYYGNHTFKVRAYTKVGSKVYYGPFSTPR